MKISKDKVFLALRNDMAKMNDDRVREWEEGLPSPGELAPLSQCLISPELASAFSITSDLPPYHTVSDVNRASHSTFATLRRTPTIALPVSDSAGIPPGGDKSGVQRGDANGGTGGEDQIVSQHFQAQSRPSGGFSSSAAMLGSYGFDGKGAFSATKSKAPPSYPSERKIDGSPVPVAACVAGTDSSDGVARNPRVEADPEPEEAESGPVQENSNEDQAAQTLKRSRLVWTPELHKRFVEVVAHLGIKNAVPKTIMQLMNVDGLTRENVASHLQKYRLYLKRMQGLSNEGPSATDQLFASTQLPPSLATSARFFPGIAGQMDEFAPLPFPTPRVPICFGRPHVAGTVNAGPFGAMDPHTYSALARPPPQRFGPRDQEMLANNQASSSHHVLRLFPTGSR